MPDYTSSTNGVRGSVTEYVSCQLWPPWDLPPSISKISKTLLIKSLSSTQDAPASNQGTADIGSPRMSSSSAVSTDKNELFKQRVLSWLNDTSEPQRLSRHISVWESIEARIAVAQAKVETLDTAMMISAETRLEETQKLGTNRKGLKTAKMET